MDEAHYIKNPDAKRTKAVKKLASHAKNKLFLTGTAIENQVQEMKNLISMLAPSVAEKIKGIETISAAVSFRQMIAPVYYRRRRMDVLTELPDLEEFQEWCDPNAEEKRRYMEAVLARDFMGLRRVSWDVRDIRMSSKAERMRMIIQRAKEEKRKVLIFSFFLETLQRIRDDLGEQCIGTICGSVPVQKRQDLVDEFDNAPPGAVLLLQIQSGGTGLNLQSASVVIFAEPQLKPSAENQALSRAYRMGQTRNVSVYRLLCENTIDEKLICILQEKQNIFDAFADESEAARESKKLEAQGYNELIEEEVQKILEERRKENAS